MNWPIALRTAAALSLLPCFAPSQDPRPVHTVFDGRLRVPIHEAPSGRGEPRELWAAGPLYKASFHDGFAYHAPGIDGPGKAAAWRWETTRIRLGGRDLIAPRDLARPVHGHTEWRYEYRYPGVVEAYDVHEDGAIAYTESTRFLGSELFQLLFAPNSGLNPVSGALVAHSAAPNGHEELVGACGAAVRHVVEPSYAGLGDYTLTLEDLPSTAAGQPGFLLIGVQPDDVPLEPFGWVGCRLRLQPLLTLPTTVTGSLRQQIPLPDRPVFKGALYTQWLHLDPGSTGTRGPALSTCLVSHVDV